MTDRWDERTRRLLGDDACERLARCRVLVVGVGGVGGYAAEMLARGGIGHLTLVDADDVDVTNINRQLIALHSTVGKPKTRLFAERFRDIGPEISVDCKQQFLTPENVDEILDEGFDYVLDCIDTVAPKVALIEACMRRKLPIISSMGAGGRVDPTKVCYLDIWQTREDGLARAVRQRLKKDNHRSKLLTISSLEKPSSRSLIEVNTQNKRSSFGTIASIPAIFGIFMANRAILDLTTEN